MNTFTRRSFLKGLLATAAAINVPVELIEQATKAIEVLPETPITPKYPACYVRINDLLVPVGSGSLSQPVVHEFDRWNPNRFECSLEFTTNRDIPYYYQFRGQEIDFALVHEKLPFEIAGRGYFTSMSYEGMILPDFEPEEWNYTYTIDGVLKKGLTNGYSTERSGFGYRPPYVPTLD